MAGRTQSRLGPVHLALLVDAAFELGVALALVFAGKRLADLLNLDSGWVWLFAAVFALAAATIAVIVVTGYSRELVWSLAAANIAGGLVLWLMFLFVRGQLDPGGRWMLAAVADSFLLVGLLEVLALWRTPVRS